ncbi:hypothetical protein LPJ53_000388 [Coemansia erecta]|uniref:CRAL-TRIO domain-containing protein n=1 Tax=Coemansia erecta TaxID=147472 RepID=A0A9W8CVQ4_9FUNG|nr:hypothetical protein LPJ53_000388 [Coemansia erecta]
MASFFSGLLGRKPAAAAEAESDAVDSAVYDTTPRLTPYAGQPVDPTPPATPEEQKTVDHVTSQLPQLLADLPAEPADAPQFNARSFLSPTRILQYVRANKNDPAKTLARLRATLLWHISYRPHVLSEEVVRQEGGTGKLFVNGWDRMGRPLMYMFPQRQNTKEAKGQLRFTVDTMEQAIRSMPEGVTKITFVIDVSQYSMAQSVALSTAREFLHILEAHYPERLGKALVISPPRMFVMFYHIIAPFIDPVTKAKVAFVDLDGSRAVSAEGPWVDINEHIDPEQLLSEVGGQWNYRYQHDAYWAEMEKSYNRSLESTGAPTKETTEDASKDDTDDASKNATEDASKDVSEDTSKGVSEDTSKDVTEDTDNNATEDTSAAEPSHDNSDKAATD